MNLNIFTILFLNLSSKGIEPFMVKNQFFYREPLLPIRSPALLMSIENYKHNNKISFICIHS